MADLDEEGPACPACGRDASAYAPQAHHLPPGTLLAERYLLGAVLGEGGFGITYVGLDTRLDVKVAVKEYYPRDKASRSAADFPAVVNLVGLPPEGFARGLQRFLEEARVMARMEKQPAIVGVRDYFEANGTAYIVMEFVEGVTLTELVAQRGGRVPSEELFPLLEPVCTALGKLHAAGLVHRDISPDNIMLEDGRARLLDFGCARETAAGRRTLTISLKYGYAPIEQYRQKGQGPWTDVYALCATMYYCLTGQTPPQPLDRIPEDTLLLPSKLGVPLTGRQEHALLKGLRIQPRRRFRSMGQLYEALYENASPLPERRGAWQPPERITISEAEKPSLRRKGWGMAAGAAVLALVLAGGLWAFLGRSAPGPAADVSPGGGEAIDRRVFDGAAELEDGAYGPETLRRLMEDDGVPAVILGEGAILDLNDPEGGPFVLEKPLMTERGSTLYANWLTVPDSGALRVDGQLDCRGVILLEGAGTRFQLEGTMSPDGEELAVVLMEQGGNLAMDQDLARTMAGRLLLLPRRENAQTVSDLWQLQEGLRLYDTLSIDGDLTLDRPYDLAGKTVFIAPGAEISAAPGAGFTLNGSVLVNEGEVSCCLEAKDAVVYNRGTLARTGDGGSVRLAAGALVLNGGVFTPDDWGFVSAGGQVVNLGRLDTGILTILGGDLVNLGRLELLASEWPSPGICIKNAGAFYNGGVFVARDDSVFDSLAWLVNDGLIQLGNCQDFRAEFIYNRHGAVEATSDDLRASGELLGPGTVRRTSESQLSWLGTQQTPALERLPEGCVTAEDEAALREALESAEPVYVPGDIALTGPLEVTAPLYIGGALTAGAEAPVTVRDAALVLWEGGSMRADTLRVYEGGRAALTDGSSLTVEPGGELTLDGPGAALYGVGRSLMLDGARITVREALFAPMRLESFTMDGADLTADGSSAVITPFRGGFSARDARISVTDGKFLLPGDAELVGADIDLSGDGSTMRCAGETVRLTECAVTVGETCWFICNDADVTMTEGTVVENDGHLWIDGKEYGRLDASGTLVNRGEMYLDVPKQVSAPIQNSGTLQLGRGDDWSDHVDVEGVPPVWE